MGIILAENSFIPSSYSRDLLENACSDTELRLEYKLRTGIKIDCPCCHSGLAHCGTHEKILKNLWGKKITVKLPRMKCSNQECPAVRNNKCRRSTHVVYPDTIIPYVRYHLPEIILLFVFWSRHQNNLLEQIKNRLRKASSTALYDAAEYFSYYHAELRRSWKQFCYVRAKKIYLHISLNFHNVFRQSRLFASFWIVSLHRCCQTHLQLKIPGTYFRQSIWDVPSKIPSGTGPPRIW